MQLTVCNVVFFPVNNLCFSFHLQRKKAAIKVKFSNRDVIITGWQETTNLMEENTKSKTITQIDLQAKRYLGKATQVAKFQMYTLYTWFICYAGYMFKCHSVVLYIEDT